MPVLVMEECGTNSLHNASEGGKVVNVPSSSKLQYSDAKVPLVTVRDNAFPLKKYLMKLYSGLDLYEKMSFNYHFSRARQVSENAFGILVRWF